MEYNKTVYSTLNKSYGQSTVHKTKNVNNTNVNNTNIQPIFDLPKAVRP